MILKSRHLAFLLVLLLSGSLKAIAQCSVTSTPTMYTYSPYNSINGFTFAGVTSNNYGSPSNGYNTFSTPVRNLTIGTNYTWSTTYYGWYAMNVAIWIDLDGNNQFDANEMLASSGTSYSYYGHSGNFTIPTTATGGNGRKMRVRTANSYGWYSWTGSQACTNYAMYGSGETEDYIVNIGYPCPMPVLSAQPQSKTNICEASTTTFSVTATLAGAYQWQRKTGPTTWTNVANGGVYSGATTKDLTITGVPLSLNNAEFRCIVTGNCSNPVTSSTATMTTLPGAFITSQSDDDTSCEGTSTKLSLTAAGSPTGYLWQMAVPTVGIYYDVPAQYPYSGVTSNTLNIASVHDTLQGYVFRASVTSQCNTPMTNNIKMNVLLPPRITTDPIDDTVNSGDFAEFKVDVTGKDYSFYWQASSDGGSNYVNINEGGLYTGVKTGALIVSPVGLGQGGWKFRCIIKSTNPSCGDYRDTSNFAMIYVRNPANIAEVSKNTIEVNAYPSPNTGSDLFIQSTVAINGNITVNVIDNVGRTVSSQMVTFSGDNTASIKTNQLAGGVYMLQLFDASGALLSKQKFTRQ